MARAHPQQQTRPEADEGRPPGRGATRVLQILLAVYLLAALPSLLVAVIKTGDYLALFAPGRLWVAESSISEYGIREYSVAEDSIPEDSILQAWWNPLRWFAFAHFIAGFLLFFPLPLVGLSVAMWARDRSPSVRARAWVWAWTAVTVLTFSPWGFALHRWMTD